LSDLRVADETLPSEHQIMIDMEFQKDMTKTIAACYSVLKFRPRFYDPRGNYRYLDYFNGTIYFQGYPRISSTETRLHVTDTESEKKYDTQLYEKQLFYHNQVTRNKYKVVFGPERLSYDNAHARFVKDFLMHNLKGRVSEGQRYDHGEPKFEHDKLRALLEEFKLLSMQS